MQLPRPKWLPSIPAKGSESSHSAPLSLPTPSAQLSPNITLAQALQNSQHNVHYEKTFTLCQEVRICSIKGNITVTTSHDSDIHVSLTGDEKLVSETNIQMKKITVDESQCSAPLGTPPFMARKKGERVLFICTPEMDLWDKDSYHLACAKSAQMAQLQEGPFMSMGNNVYGQIIQPDGSVISVKLEKTLNIKVSLPASIPLTCRPLPNSHLEIQSRPQDAFIKLSGDSSVHMQSAERLKIDSEDGNNTVIIEQANGGNIDIWAESGAIKILSGQIDELKVRGNGGADIQIDATAKQAEIDVGSMDIRIKEVTGELKCKHGEPSQININGKPYTS